MLTLVLVLEHKLNWTNQTTTIFLRWILIYNNGKSRTFAQSKPAGTTNTLLYSAPIDKSASAVLTIANDGTGSTYDVAIKDYDQKLVVRWFWSILIA